MSLKVWFVYKELDEKIMLGLRLKEGVDLKEVFKGQNWDNKKFRGVTILLIVIICLWGGGLFFLVVTLRIKEWNRM